MAGNEERLLRREHKHVRQDLDFLGLMGAPDGEPRGPKPGAPEDGVAWEDGKLVQIHFDKYADIIPPSAWRRLVYKAAAAVSAATADVARSFIAVWQEEDRSTAQRHLEETIEEPEIAAPYFGTEPIGRRAE